MLTARAHVLSTLLYKRTLHFRGQANLSPVCAGTRAMHRGILTDAMSHRNCPVGRGLYFYAERFT